MDSLRWQEMSAVEQMANIGADVGRAFKWKAMGNKEKADGFFFFALECFDAAIQDNKNKSRKKEFYITKELFADIYLNRGEFGETAEGLEEYFTQFSLIART